MKGYNLSKVIRWIETILAIVVILNFAVTFYAIDELTESSLTSVSNRLATDIDNLSDALSGIHSMMVSEVGYDKDLDKLLVADEFKVGIDELAIKRRIKTMITIWSNELPYSVHYAIYFPGNDIIIDDCDTAQDYELWRSVKDEMLAKLNELDFKSNWNIVELGLNYYLVDIIGNNGRYMFAYIRLEEIVDSLGTEFYGADYYIAVTDQESNIFHHREDLLQDRIPPMSEGSNNMKRYRIRQKLVIHENIDGRINFLLVINNYNSVLKAFRVQIFIGILMIGVVSLVLLILKLVNKTVLRPIQMFNANVETLKTNEIYDVTTHYQITELGNASKLMSEMVGRIKDLKIDIYEKTLEQQKTKMDFLTLQIEPHFYLNCLNIIYHMAQMEQYKEIQKLSNCVTEYLRYLFKSNESFSTVEEELEHIKKYLEIQKIRYGECFETHIRMDDRILKAKLPPLILQTFVENSLKYTINWEDDIELYLIGNVDHEAVIVIEDTGDGFGEEILYKLQHGEDISEGPNKIGIMNAISRMKLTFGDDSEIRFYNRSKGGAGVEIKFPYQENEVD